MRLLRNGFVILASLLLWSCEDSELEVEIRPVIEAYIDSDGFPRVMFTSTLADGDNQTIEEKVVRWGKVTMSDGVTTVILTGGPDKSQFPPFRYTSYELKGVPGRTYTIEAQYKDLHAKAQCTMPEPPEVEEVKDVCAAESDTLRDVALRIRAPQDVPAYFHVSVRTYPAEDAYLPAMLGCVKAEKPGEIVELPVYMPKVSIGKNLYDASRLPSNRAVDIKVERVSKEIYEFWMNFNNANLFGGSMFVTTSASIGGNIEGGYGYFSAQGVKIISLPQR